MTGVLMRMIFEATPESFVQDFAYECLNESNLPRFDAEIGLLLLHQSFH